jgi:hypothetical protein
MHKIASIRTRPRHPWRVTCPHAVRTSSGGSHQFAYSPQGQVSATQLNLSALTLGTHLQRNAQSQVTRVLYPSGRALDITWSQVRPSTLSFGSQPLVPHLYTRDTQGRLIRHSLGGGACTWLSGVGVH